MLLASLSLILADAITSGLTHELAPVIHFRDSIPVGRGMQDWLIYEEVSIGHFWHLLHEREWILREIVRCFISDGTTSRTVTKPFVLDEHGIIFNSCHFDLNKLIDILRILNGLFIEYITLLILTKQCLAANWSHVLSFMSISYSTDLRSCQALRRFHNFQIIFKI